MYSIVDSYNRSFSNLRVSLTDDCNFACLYCTDTEPNKPQLQKPLKLEELQDCILKIHQVSPLSKIRLTGGEPLLYVKLIDFLNALADNGFTNVSITTNAFLLNQRIKELAKTQLKNINISIDAIDKNIFTNITRKGTLDSVLDGIDAAIEHGFTVKLNAVIMRGINHNQIIPLLEFAQNKNIPIRFLELMKMGYMHTQYAQYFFSQQEILDTISHKYSISKIEREKSATARYWKTNTQAVFGIIANESEPFCADCNRIRLDRYGNVFGCLSSAKAINIKNCNTNNQMKDIIKELLAEKKMVFTGSLIGMKQIGG